MHYKGKMQSYWILYQEVHMKHHYALKGQSPRIAVSKWLATSWNIDVRFPTEATLTRPALWSIDPHIERVSGGIAAGACSWPPPLSTAEIINRGALPYSHKRVHGVMLSKHWYNCIHFYLFRCNQTQGASFCNCVLHRIDSWAFIITWMVCPCAQNVWGEISISSGISIEVIPSWLGRQWSPVLLFW